MEKGALKMRLNCENVEKTYESLSKIFGISKAYLQDIIRENLLIPENNDSGKLKHVLLFYQLSNKIPQISESIIEGDTVYFHMSRVLDPYSFKKGIYPLNEILDQLYKELHDFVDMLDISKLKHKRVLGNSYNSVLHRMSYSYLLGPYALLIKEVSECTENKHFLNVPETISDILSKFEYEYQKDFMEEYKRIARPCIVKFLYPGIRKVNIVSSLYYLYCKEHGLPLDAETDQGFDGRGIGIPQESIIGIELL
jgi:hypothetical protein